MKRLFVTAAVVAVAALAGCGPQKVVRAPCPSGKVCLELGLGAEPTVLDPHRSSGHWESEVISNMLVGLMEDDVRGEPVAGMATHWETSADGLTWTFHLREAKWSDGVPVTADDFVFSLRRIMKPELAAEYASILYPIKNAKLVNEGQLPPEQLGVFAPNPRTVVITLEHPAPYLLQLAKHQTMAPTPKHVVEKFGDEDWMKPGNYVANGPYKLVSWNLGDRVTLEKNPLYWDAASVCADRVNYYPTEDRISGERQALSGALDMNTPLVPNRVPYLRKIRPDWTRVSPMLGTTYLVFNGEAAKFKDKRIREALAMAIDRDFITRDVRGMGEPSAYTLVPPGIANYTAVPGPAWSTWPIERRQEEARRLLKEAGFTPERPLKFQFMHRGYDPTGTYAAVQADWKLIGVQATLIATETQIAYQNLRIRDFEMGEAAWVADYNDPMNFLYLLDSKTGAHNYGGYNNPAFDALLAQANTEPDLGRRAELLRQAESMMLADIPIIPIYSYASSNIVNPRLTGWETNISDNHRAKYMCLAGARN